MNLEKLSPAFQDYLWGGTKLRDLYGKHCDLGKVAESWELSTHPAGESKIQGGRYDGLTLGQYLQQVGKAALGRNAAAFENFPVLIKLCWTKWKSVRGTCFSSRRGPSMPSAPGS